MAEGGVGLFTPGLTDQTGEGVSPGHGHDAGHGDRDSVDGPCRPPETKKQQSNGDGEIHSAGRCFFRIHLRKGPAPVEKIVEQNKGERRRLNGV